MEEGVDEGNRGAGCSLESVQDPESINLDEACDQTEAERAAVSTAQTP